MLNWILWVLVIGKSVNWANIGLQYLNVVEYCGFTADLLCANIVAKECEGFV